MQLPVQQTVERLPGGQAGAVEEEQQRDGEVGGHREPFRELPPGRGDDGDDDRQDDEDDEPEGMIFSRAAVTNSLLNKLKAQVPKPDNRVDASVLNKRLDLIGGM